MFFLNCNVGTMSWIHYSYVPASLYFTLFNRMDKFFDRLADDLETYAVHAKRKTIEVEDVELLLRR